MQHQNSNNPNHSSSRMTVKWVIIGSLVIVAFYLIAEHKAHLFAYSSYILFAAFIFMHLFMHKGHGGHGGHGDNSDDKGGHNHKIKDNNNDKPL